MRQAGEGEVTAKHVDEKLAQIVAAVTKVTEIVAEIAATAKEQAAGIEQVNKAVAQMNSVTQQNAASSEESSAAAAELSEQSRSLTALLESFQVEPTTAAARPRSEAASVVQPRGRGAGPLRSRAKPVAKRHAGSTAGPAGIALRPEEVIPMDGDPGFAEF